MVSSAPFIRNSAPTGISITPLLVIFSFRVVAPEIFTVPLLVIAVVAGLVAVAVIIFVIVIVAPSTTSSEAI